MEEEQWLVCCNPERMLSTFQSRTSARKLRLIACAWVRLLWNLLTPCCRNVVEITERYAEGGATEADLVQAKYRMTELSRRSPAKAAAAWAAFFAAGDISVDLRDCLSKVRLAAARQERQGELDLAQCLIVRDVVGNPFRPISISPVWLTWNGGRVVRLAQAAYDNRPSPAGALNNARLLLLADALVESGCTDAAILNHCRQPGEHVRGCWILDLLLNKRH